MANTITSSMTNTLAGAGSAGVSSGTPGAPRSAIPEKELSKDLFLKLMMAQLKNQNPLNPVDGTAFLGQLSQISSVEQMVAMRQQLEDIHKILGSQAATNTASGPPADS